MALIIKQPGSYPLGQFDGYDTQVYSLKGGEVMSLYSIPVTNTDHAAKDVFDGYTDYQLVQTRTIAGLYSTASAIGTNARPIVPLFLSDEGIAGYGTIFGTVVGQAAGQISYANTAAGAAAAATAGNLLGPSTATGSGKVTLWDKPGLYGVTLDAVDSVTASGLVPTNTSLNTGTAVTWVTSAQNTVGSTSGWSTAGQLTPSAASNPSTGGTNAGTPVGFFVEFESNGSLVTTPNTLVAGYSSPSNLPGGANVGPRTFYLALITFRP